MKRMMTNGQIKKYCLMKKITLFSAAVLCIIAAASCAKEINDLKDTPIEEAIRTTTLRASIVDTKTALGAKESTSWPNYWKENDVISVNGIDSDALDAAYDGQTTASFNVTGTIDTPYYAAYPAAAVSAFNAGSATITIPAKQTYVAGSYDPAAFIMVGTSDVADEVSLSAKVSIFHLSLTGSGSISRVRLTGAAGKALSGSFTTDFTALTPADASNVVEMVPDTPVALPAEFFICVPGGLDGEVVVEVFDNEGGSMKKKRTLTTAIDAGHMYSPKVLAYSPTYAPKIYAEGITSSTAVICWDSDPAPAYTVGVYSDAGCNTLVDSYAVPADASCWGGESPRFCISGLDAATTYYVKVTNVAKSADSNVLSVTTADFQIVEVTPDPAAVGDVILAEDFSELRWDCDMIGGGVGWFPTDAAQSSFSTVNVDSFRALATSGELQLSSQTNALAGSRLLHWAQGANRNMYIHPGYIKLVGSNKVTHLVTPALDNIPESKVATLEVEVTASRYYSASSDSYATDKAIVAVQAAGSYSDLLANGVNTLNLESNIANITLKAETAWNTYKVTLNGVAKGDRLAFGADKSVTKNEARMNISDMKVTIKELYDAGTLTATAKGVSSSTAVFTWTHAGSASQDVAKPYTIALYRNSACTDLVVSHDIPADDACWNGKIPCFVFGGLDSDTEYWFVATDTDAGISSDPVSTITDAFTVVNAADVDDAVVGDVLLAEDFSEIGAGPDELEGAASFVPANKELPVVPSGVNPDGSFCKASFTGDRVFGAGWSLGSSRLSNGWGFFGNSSVYYQNGFLRVSTTSGRTHVVTPVLSGIPAGKEATIKVTVTASKLENNSNDVAVFVEKGLTMNTIITLTSPSYRKYTGASLSNGHGLGITSVKAWETKSVTIYKVESGSQLVIGSLENISGKNRFLISDVTVTLEGLKNPGDLDAVMEINDFTTLKAFLTACEPGKTIQGNVTADIDLSTSQAEELDALYPVAEFDGIVNGNNHTISGLTKPLFDHFTGTASNLTLNSSLNITTAMNNVGIFAQSASNATLTACVSKGSVTSSVSEVSGDLALGGLVGSISDCTLTACQNHATVTNNTEATGTACVGGLIGVADGANDLSGSTSEYNFNQGLIIEDSATENVAVGGVCGYSLTAASNFNYCKSLAPDDPTDYDDIEIRNNTKNKVYVGGIIGKSAVTSSMDYTYNSSDIKFTSLKITQTGQVFGGGIIGGWSASGVQTITGCENKGWVYTKGSAGDLAVADSENLPKYWSCFAGISGMGAGTSENLGSGWNTITGKTFTNCTNSGTIRIYAALRSCIAGVVAYTENNPDGCVCNAENIRPYLSGGIKQVGENYHRNICGGVVGLFTGNKVSNLKSTAKIVSQSSSPFAYTGGIIGYVPAGTIELENCKVSNQVQAAGSNDGRSALMCHVAQNDVTVTFTDCVVKSGTLSYATGSKVSISSSNISAQHCVGPGSHYTIVDADDDGTPDLPSVASSI